MISYIADGVTVAVGVFVLSFALSGFYLGKGFYRFIISGLLSIAFTALYIRSAKKRRGDAFLKGKEKDLYENLRDYLCFIPPRDAEIIVGEKLSEYPDILSENTRLKCLFLPEPLSANDIIPLLWDIPPDTTLTVVGVSFTRSALDLIQKTDRIKLVTLEKIAPSFKDLPVKTEKKKKRSFRSLFAITFDRKKAKVFALYGAALLLMSNFVFYPVWYIISGCVFSLYALTALFFPSTDDKRPSYI
ncbi:MAG: hypothetical protein IJ800_04250 [Clostridia bacterium]|nr:hypothetical protein [Clostridia bacterium]